MMYVAVGQWDTRQGSGMCVTYFFTTLSLLRWDITTSGFPVFYGQNGQNGTFAALLTEFFAWSILGDFQ
jgi:hypothetical protein